MEATLLKVEIYSSLDTYLMDALNSLHQVLPLVIESNSLTLRYRLHNLYARIALKIRRKGLKLSEMQTKQMREQLAEQSSLVQEDFLNASDIPEVHLFSSLCESLAVQ